MGNTKKLALGNAMGNIKKPSPIGNGMVTPNESLRSLTETKSRRAHISISVSVGTSFT